MTFDEFMEMQLDPGWIGATELARRAWEHQQAEIDALMLEYCPDEMTPEQIENWERHQQAVPSVQGEPGRVMTEQREKAASEPPLDCRVGRDELPGKNARAMLPLLEELAERDAEIARQREELKGWHDFGRGLLAEAKKIGMDRLTVPMVLNACGEPGGTNHNGANGA